MGDIYEVKQGTTNPAKRGYGISPLLKRHRRCRYLVQPVIDRVGLRYHGLGDENRNVAIRAERGCAIGGCKRRIPRISHGYAAADKNGGVLTHEALQSGAIKGFGVNVKILTSVRIRTGRNKPLGGPNEVLIGILSGRRSQAQVVQLHHYLVAGSRRRAWRGAHLTDAGTYNIELGHVRAARAVNFILPVSSRVAAAVEWRQTPDIHRRAGNEEPVAAVLANKHAMRIEWLRDTV